jgi:hypothetical protein
MINKFNHFLQDQVGINIKILIKMNLKALIIVSDQKIF